MAATAQETGTLRSDAPKVSAISVEHVSLVYPGRQAGQAVVALDDVSLEVAPGEFVCLLGPSGCGKSTLLNIIGGLLLYKIGTVKIGDRVVAGPSPDDVAFVFQESTLLPWFTILENFRISSEFKKQDMATWKERATMALAAVGMQAFADHYPNQLSVGMRQRVNLARGTFLDTDILLMDEPFAALDEQTRMVLGEDLSVLLARTRKTIVFVTHSLAEAVFLADRIVVMTARPGRIKSVLKVEEAHPRSPDFMLTPRFNEIRTRLFEFLRDEIRQSVSAMRDARDLGKTARNA
jgi:ABC-type nitrate/sulfonate/bicarbonate transport system ATPase subunit